MFDDEAYGDKLRRWATEELRTFRVEAWPEPPVVNVAGVVGGIDASGSRMEIVMSKTVSHRRPDGSWIDVVSHRPDDLEALRKWAPLNMLTRAKNRELPPDASASKRDAAEKQVRRQAIDGTVPWCGETIFIDGAEVRIDVMECGDGWVATGAFDDVYVTLDSKGVERSGLRLVSLRAR